MTFDDVFDQTFIFTITPEDSAMTITTDPNLTPFIDAEVSENNKVRLSVNGADASLF